MTRQMKSALKSLQRPSRIELVPIPLMQVPPAWTSQRKFQKSWGDELAANLDLNKLGYPICNLRDGVYWLCDGQHRIYALKEFGLGNESLECEVYEGLSDAEMAEMFLGRNNSKAVRPLDKFFVAVTAGHAAESDIKKVVEAAGLKVSASQKEGSITAVSAMRRVYDRDGVQILGQTLRTIKQAFAADKHAFDAAVIEGVGLVFGRYRSKISESDLTRSLTGVTHGVLGLQRKAEVLRVRFGHSKAQCVAAAIIEEHNKGKGPRAGKRLAPWWKVVAEEAEEDVARQERVRKHLATRGAPVSTPSAAARPSAPPQPVVRTHSRM